MNLINKKRLKRIYIEITNICNFDCVFCPGTKRPKRFLPPEEFRVCITTDGTLLEERYSVLAHAECLHKISVSLHCMEGNHMKK